MKRRSEKLSRIKIKLIIPIITAIISIVFMYLGITKYGFWDGAKGPLSGFFPTLVGALLLFMSLLAFSQDIKSEKTSLPVKNWLVPLSVVAILVSTYLIGLIASCFVYFIVWTRFVEKYSWKTTIKTTAVVGGIVVAVFVFWLSVPFPKGIILNAIL